ncbi:MAG TPA: AmmeMemoRadiSam system protein A [Alphaproteobacteria bacterium]|nr:AmmeMemoRadiSam system protein A [Alphaproteobacteria bacterium]
MTAAEDPGLARVAALLERYRDDLLALAAASIRYPLTGRKPVVRPEDVQADLAAPGASFITLTRGSELRGCIGSQRAWRPLVTDVIENAAAAAFQDPRFPPLTKEELSGLALSVSLLTPPVPVPAASEAELLSALRPGRDGVILIDGACRGLFLPQMWEQLPTSEEFMRWLKRKAGLPETHWSPTVRISRFETLSVKIDDIAEIGEPAFASRVG